MKITITNNLTGKTRTVEPKVSKRDLNRYTSYFSKSREGDPKGEKK